MKKYKQLDLQYRHKIKALLDAGHNKTKIAEIIGVHKSTISLKLNRNVPKRRRYTNEYRAKSAQQITNKRKHIRFTKGLKQDATQCLREEKHSPGLISVCWEVQGGILTGCVGIKYCSGIVEQRTRLGDLEADFMMGKAHKSALLVITDRATLLTRLKKVTSRKAEHTEAGIEQMLARVPKAFIKTLTLDNDKGFANHPLIGNKLDANVYFTRPYTSQGKGTVKNRIGVIPEFFPKGTDLRDVSEQRIKNVKLHLNNRPIRKFETLSPIQPQRDGFATNPKTPRCCINNLTTEI